MPLPMGGQKSKEKSLTFTYPFLQLCLIALMCDSHATHAHPHAAGGLMPSSLPPIDILHQKMTETCASAHIGGVNIVLLEGITPNIQ